MFDELDRPEFSAMFVYPSRRLTERQQERDIVPDLSPKFLLTYYHRYMLDVARSGNSDDFIKKREVEGRVYRNARRHAGLFAIELVADLRQRHCPTTYEELLALEQGLITAKDMPEQFMQTFKQILIGRLERTFCKN